MDRWTPAERIAMERDERPVNWGNIAFALFMMGLSFWVTWECMYAVEQTAIEMQERR